MNNYVLSEISEETAEVIKVSFLDRISSSFSSKGNQIKWKKGNKIIKLNLLGYEDVAEVLVSHLLRFSSLESGIDYIEYYSCIIIEDNIKLGVGCYSYDYTYDGKYKDISAAKFLKRYNKSFGIEYWDFLDFMEDLTGYNVKTYIDRILCLDAITRNEDRHFGNINFIFNEKSELVSVPIYDNGCSCLSDVITYPMSVSFDENFSRVHSKPFAYDFERQIHNPIRLLLNVNGFFNSVRIYSDEAKRALSTIENGLRITKNIAWEEF